MEDLRELLPSAKAEAKAKAELEARERAEARAASLRHDFTMTFQTEAGKRVLAWLRQRCGHNKIILSATKEGTIDPMMTTFAAMELNLYLEIRKHLPPQLLMEIEYEYIDPSGTVRDPITGGTIERTNSKPRSTKRKRRA